MIYPGGGIRSPQYAQGAVLKEDPVEPLSWKVVITGTHQTLDVDQQARVASVLMTWIEKFKCEYAHGGCPTGVDEFAHKLLSGNGRAIKIYRADWDEHGKKAGPIRNSEMLEGFLPDIVLAFPLKGDKRKSPGTWDCFTKAVCMGISVMVEPL